jgi:iron complex outermembrane receptor protein
MDAYLNKKVHASVTVFQRRDSNDIDYVRANPNDIWVATNFDKLHFTGLEASTEYTPVAGQTIGLAFTALHGLSENSDVLESKYTFNYPVESAVVQWRGSMFERHVIARTRIGIVNRLQHYPYTVWDASAGYALGHVRPYLQLTNITNADYQEILAVAMPSRGIAGGVELVFAGLKH